MSIVLTERLAQTLRIFADAIEQRPIRAAGWFAGGNRRHSIEDEPRIDLLGERLRGRPPGDMRAVDARVTDGGVNAGTHRLGAELQRRQRSVLAQRPGGDLVHRHTAAVEIDACGFGDRGASEPGGVLYIVSV